MKGNQAGRRGESAADGNWKVGKGLGIGKIDEFCLDHYYSQLYVNFHCVNFSWHFLVV